MDSGATDLKGITLETELDPSTSQGTCDASRGQQVMWNLLTNAIKFIPKGGTVRVTLSRERRYMPCSRHPVCC